KFSPFHLARFGEMSGERSARAARLEQCLAAAGIDADLSDDIEAAIWKKFIMLVGMSAMTALTRMPIGAVREDRDTRAMLQEIMSEAMAVARARGISLADDLVADRLRFIDGVPYEVRASMAMDLANGRRLELPWLSGAVVRLGNEPGVATPANRVVTTALKLHINGAAARSFVMRHPAAVRVVRPPPIVPGVSSPCATRRLRIPSPGPAATRAGSRVPRRWWGESPWWRR